MELWFQPERFPGFTVFAEDKTDFAVNSWFILVPTSPTYFLNSFVGNSLSRPPTARVSYFSFRQSERLLLIIFPKPFYQMGISSQLYLLLVLPSYFSYSLHSWEFFASNVTDSLYSPPDKVEVKGIQTHRCEQCPSQLMLDKVLSTTSIQRYAMFACNRQLCQCWHCQIKYSAHSSIPKACQSISIQRHKEAHAYWLDTTRR